MLSNCACGGVFAHALHMITLSLSSATLSCLVLSVVHTYYVQSNINFLSSPHGKRERVGLAVLSMCPAHAGSWS